MDVNLTFEQERYIRRAVEAGRLEAPEAALKEAVALWVERERDRLALLADIDDAEASLAKGEGQRMSPADLSALVDEVRRRGMDRLAKH